MAPNEGILTLGVLSMEYIRRIIAFRINRFAVAGAINTATNFAVLNFMYYVLHQNKMTSIMVATSCAIAVSFMLNRNFVFMDKERPIKRLPQFLAVSIIGVFLIQNSVYALCIIVLHNHEAGIAGIIQNATSFRLSDSFISVNLSNVIASLAVMVWNYNGYRIFVFKGKRLGNEIVEDINAETT